MPNDLVTAHRALVQDPRTDEEITAAYAASPQASQYMAGYPSFAAEVNGQSAPPAPYQPTLVQDFGQGAASGLAGLESTAYGLGALVSAAVGAQGARDYFLAKAQEKDEDAALNPPSVASIGEAFQSPGNAAHYFFRKAGAIAPAAAQAAVTGLVGAGAGAIAGAGIDPAGGEVPGAVGGALYGIFESQATKMLIEKAATAGIADTLKDAFVQKALPGAIKGLAKNYGAKAAEIANFWGQSAGSTYNTLAKNPDVDPQTAIDVSILGGLAQAVPAAYLPSTIIGKYFGEGASVGPYYARLASQAARLVPGGAGAMSLQELAAIASEKYADPKTKADAFDISKWTPEDKSRLLESSVTGGLMGAIGTPLAALPHGEPPPGNKPPEIPDLVKNYTGDLPVNELHDLVTLASRELTGTLGIEGKQALANLTPEQKNAYPVIKDSVEKGFAKPAFVGEAPKPSEADIRQAYEQFKPQGQTTQPLTVNAPEVIGNAPSTPGAASETIHSSQPTFPAPPEEGKPALTVPPTVVPVVPESIASPNIPQRTFDNSGTIVEQSGNGINHLQLREAAQKIGEVLPGMPRLAHENLAQITSPYATPTQKDELSQLRKRLFQAGETGQEALRALRELEVGEASRGLQQAAGGALVVPGMPPESSQVKTAAEQEMVAKARVRSAQALSSEETPQRVSISANPDAYNPERQADIARYKELTAAAKAAFQTGKALSPEFSAEIERIKNKYGGQPPDASDELIAQAKASKAARDAAATPKVEVAEPPIKGFTTAKGSTYEVNEDGTTTRNKAARPEHPGEQGPQPKSAATYYVSPQDALLLGEIQSLGGGPKRTISKLSDGRIGVKYLEGKDNGKFEKRTVVTPDKTPRKGLTPVEVFENGKVHFGNEITEIHTGDVPKPVSAKNAPAETPPIFHEKVVEREGPIVPASVSTDHPFDTSERKADFFEITPEQADDPKALAKDLVSGAAEGSQSHQTTKRVTIVQDNKTGKVFALSTYMDKNAGVVRISDPEKVGEPRGRVTSKFSDFIGEKTADGKPRYTPIASIKLNERKNALIQEFPDRAAYDKELGDPAKEKIAEKQRETRTLEQAVPTATPPAPGEPVPAGVFTAEHANVLHNLFGDLQQEGTREGFEKEFTEIVRSKSEDADALREAIVPIFEDALLKGHSEVESLAIAKAQIYELLKDRNSRGAEAFAESALRRFNQGAVETAETPTPPAGQQPAERQPQGQGGAEVANPDALRYRRPGQEGPVVKKDINAVHPGPDQNPDRLTLSNLKALRDKVGRFWRAEIEKSEPNDAETKRLLEQYHALETEINDRLAEINRPVLRNPTQVRTDASARHEQLLDSIHKAALDAGLNVTSIGQDISGMTGDFAKRTGASYDSASRTIAQVVGDVIGKEDVITSLHEVAHDVFSTLPAADRARVLAAVDSLSDRQIGTDLSSDPRIKTSNPDALPRAILSEERLAESTALKLEAQGFDPSKARGLARQFVRALKDLYLRAAMSVQRALFGDSFTNPELATRFFQNKVEAFLAGDFTKRSFIDLLGGGKPSEAMSGRWHNTSHNLTFERVGANGSIEYDSVPNSSIDAAQLNNLKFRRPQSANPDDQHSRQVEIEKQAARFNLKADILATAAKDAEIIRLAKELKVDPQQLLLDRLGLTSPEEFRKTLAGVQEQDGTPVKFDPDKKIDGFKAESNAASVTADAYRDVQSDLSHVSGVKTDARQAKDELIRRRENELQAHEETKANYTDTQYSTAVATRALQAEGGQLIDDVATNAKKLGAIGQQLKAIDPEADLRKYARVFQKLFTGDELKGEKLFNVLDTLANDPNIDFSKSITEIRQQMLAQGDKYEKYVQHTPESRALTAAIVSFAKTHAQIMANLELRRMANGADRVEIAKKLDALKKQGVNFTKAFRDLPKTAILEDRAKQAYRKSMARVASASRRIEIADQKIKAADAMAGVLAKHEAELAGKLAIGADSVFRDEMPINIPAAADSTSESVIASKGKLTLNPSTGKVNTPEEVEAILRKQSAFIEHREQQYADGNFNALDSVYQGVKRQRDQIAANKNFKLNYVPAQRFLTALSFMPDGKRLADGIGDPGSRRAEQRVNRYTSNFASLKPNAERVGLRTGELEDRLLKLFPEKIADARNYLRRNFLTPAKDVFHHSEDLAEKYAGNPTGLQTALMNRVMTTLLNQESTVRYLRGHETEWRTGIEDLLNHQAEATRFNIAKVKEYGLSVLDPSLKTRNPATGDTVSASRLHIPKGPVTFSQRMADNFRTMVGALRGTGWTSTDAGERTNAHADFSHIAGAIDSNDLEAAHKLVDKYFANETYGDQVRNHFFRDMAEPINKESLFPAPLNEDGVTRPPVDLALQHQAWSESGGDPLKFAERLWELHDGQEVHGEAHEDGSPAEPVQTKGSYMQSVMTQMADTAQEAHRILNLIEPDPNTTKVGIKGMFANALIDARQIDHLPSAWFDYHDFDQRDTFKTAERIAAEGAYGRNGEYLDADLQAVNDYVKDSRTKLAAVTSEVKSNNPEAAGKVLKKLIIAKLSTGGKDGVAEYNRLDKINRRANLPQKFIRGISDYYRKDNAPDGTLRVITRASHLLGQLMTNQPSSALTLGTQLVDMNLRFGSSKAVQKQTLGNFGIAGKEVAGSLLNAIGVQLKSDGDNQLWNDLGLTDPANVRKFGDIFDRLHGESALAHGFRATHELLDTPIGSSNPSQFVKLRAGIFNYAGQVADKTITKGVWRLTRGLIGKGVDFYRDNADALTNPDFKLDADKLGLKGADKDTFQRMTSLMQKYGSNYEDMVRSAMTNPDKIGFSNQDAINLYTLAISEVALNANLSSRPSAFYNNAIIRAISPLLGWSFSRAGQVGQFALNTEGQIELKSAARALAGLSVTALGGLATTALIDQYYQTALGKQRNLRPITAAPNLEQEGLALLENLNRVGTVGMWGELANGLVNVGQGGDNRVISVDQRVLAISSLQSVQQAISSWINQGYVVDYSHVGRPLLGAMGGGGLIQYLQLANNALGLDNAEARVTARINAQNYLRVAGRELGLDVRETSAGLNFTPTLITPFLTRMELAAYKNNPGDFRAAYQQAIEAAKAAGKDDPISYVRSAFESRNPLKSVFTTTPSAGEYGRILATLPNSGSQDVTQAVNLFNQFSQSIGGKAFTGREPKQTKTEPISLGEIRQRSAMALH